MLYILLDAKPTGHDQANSRMLQLFYGMKVNMLKLVANSALRYETATIVIHLPPKAGEDFYFLDIDEELADRFKELFYGRLEIIELAEKIVKGEFVA